ncbi:MAG: acetylxylan esterase, partial [Lentisphaeria bacterium]|nr:acetylxylan esterase [Lentisphaeria bacterium]
WPQLHKVSNGKADKAYAYFDVAVFASRVNVPVLVSVGFVDTTCAPSSVYSAYNALAGEKEIFHMYRNSHSISEESKEKITSFIGKHLK